MTWSKEEAIARVDESALLKRALDRNPELRRIVEVARGTTNRPGYDRIKVYYALKAEAGEVSGYHRPGHTEEEFENFDAVVHAIDELLPPDDVDTHSEGKPSEEDEE